VQKKNKKIHTTNTPVLKKNHKVCGKNNCDKSRASKFFKNSREKTNNKIFELLVFHRIFFPI